MGKKLRVGAEVEITAVVDGVPQRVCGHVEHISTAANNRQPITVRYTVRSHRYSANRAINEVKVL